jgi:hypothetical protein
MASVISGGTNAFDHMLYGAPNQEVQQFVTNLQQNVTSMLTQEGLNFVQQTRQDWSKFFGEEAARLARAGVRRIASLWDDNSIKQLVGVAQLQHAPIVMQPFIMAQPEIRQAYFDQQIDGYSDTYVNEHGKDIGEDHYHYQCVMSGIVEDTEDGEEWRSVTYFQEYDDPADQLNFDQKIDILCTWNELLTRYKTGRDDPTSRYNSSLW